MQPTEASAADGSLPVWPVLGRLGEGWRWLAGNFIAERERWVLWLPVFVGVGVGVYFWLTLEPSLWLGPFAVALTMPAAVIAYRRQSGAVPALAIAAVALGFAAASFQAWWVAAPILAHKLTAVSVEGRVVAVDPQPEGMRLVLEPRHIDRLDDAQRPVRLRVKLRHEAPDLLPGDWIKLRATLLPPPAPAMPGAYDFQRRAYFDRLGAVGYALGAPEKIAAPANASVSLWRHAVEAVRAAVTERIRAALPGPTGAIAAALITGETHAIPPADAGAFRDAGLAHILVIAGLHMGMVAAAVFFAVRAGLALIHRSRSAITPRNGRPPRRSPSPSYICCFPAPPCRRAALSS